MKILIHGTLDFDRIMYFGGRFEDVILQDQLRKLNISLPIERVEERFGGGAGAMAYTLRLLDESPVIMSVVGNDGAPYIEYLRRLGLSTEYIQVYPDAKTSTFTVVNDANHHQFGMFYSGALRRNVPFSTADFNPADTVMILSPRDNNPETAAYARQCQQAGLRYVFDPGQTVARYSRYDLEALIQGAYMLTLNEYEMRTLQQMTRMTTQDLLEYTEYVVITRGEEGSQILTRDGELTIPRCSSDRIVDTTSAGDAYRAGILKGIAIGATVEQMGKIGAVAATYTIEHHGSQEHYFTIEAFCKRYEDNFAEECPLRK